MLQEAKQQLLEARPKAAQQAQVMKPPKGSRYEGSSCSKPQTLLCTKQSLLWLQGSMGEIKRFWTSIPAEQQTSLLRVKLEDVRTRARSLDAQSKQGSGKALVQRAVSPAVSSQICAEFTCSLLTDLCINLTITVLH